MINLLLKSIFIRKLLKFCGCTKFAEIVPPDTVQQEGQFSSNRIFLPLFFIKKWTLFKVKVEFSIMETLTLKVMKMRKGATKFQLGMMEKTIGEIFFVFIVRFQ